MAYSNMEFFAKIKDDVIADSRAHGICASMTAAQALIESASGNSGLTQRANNLFGIKGTYKGHFVTMRTQEWSPSKGYYAVDARFRKYPSWKESIQDHTNFLLVNSRYKNLIGVMDYKTACVLIHKDGYATSPTYAQTLINTIERFGLNQWDSPQGTKVDTSGYPLHRLGMRSEYVRLLQNALTLRGFPCDADGIFGKQTESQVIAFQKSVFPTQPSEWDGIVGRNTWRMLFA